MKKNFLDTSFMEFSDLIPAPSGYFLNHPHNIMSVVPNTITINRWKSLINSTIENNSILHMWLHPHNLITAPKLKCNFKEIIAYLGHKVKNGELLNCAINQL